MTKSHHLTKPIILARGAEAIITKQGQKVLKTRIKKSYRLPKLDKQLRKRRTKAEAKILEKVSKLIPAPKVFSSSNTDFKIQMQYIAGKKLSDHLDKLKNKKTIAKQIGKNIAFIHDAGIIHGDLTTSNMILKDKKVFFIDFGLGFHSNKIEDKAVDLHLISQALEAKHHKYHQLIFKAILEGYKKSKNYSRTIAQLQKVEKRGRYKH